MNKPEGQIIECSDFKKVDIHNIDIEIINNEKISKEDICKSLNIPIELLSEDCSITFENNKQFYKKYFETFDD